MSVTNRQAVWCRGALFERGLGAQGRVQLVGVDADILGDLGPGCDGRSAYGREERFGKHDTFEYGDLRGKERRLPVQRPRQRFGFWLDWLALKDLHGVYRMRGRPEGSVDALRQSRSEPFT